MPRAFITGVTGQDGQHMAEFLHSKGYEVFGMVKGQNNPKEQIIREEFPYVNIVPGDLADLPSLVKALEVAQRARAGFREFRGQRTAALPLGWKSGRFHASHFST